MAQIQLIVSYEDGHVADFFPLTRFRPVGLLRSGILPLFSRLKRLYPEQPFVIGCRSAVAPLVRTQFPELGVNPDIPAIGNVLFIASRLRHFGDLAEKLAQAKQSVRLVNGDGTVGIFWQGELQGKFPDVTDKLRSSVKTLPTVTTTASFYRGAWEIMADIGDEITADFAYLSPEFPRARTFTLHEGAYLLGKEKIYLSEGVEIMPGVVLDARPGPIVIGAHTRLEPQTTIIGPCYIGPNSLVPFGRIADCSIGEVCRVGGEVEASIFQSYSNKYHAGFIGHAYVGSWVNFGAMTTNSDLKNNYSTIRLHQNGRDIDTGSIKVGSFIGDHTKFGIGTLLNTGITIGCCSNIFGGSLVSEKVVGDFCWGGNGAYHSYELSKAVETIQRTMLRRGVKLPDAEKQLIVELSEGKSDMSGTLDFD